MLTPQQHAWLREKGIRTSPDGMLFAAETRGGNGHPIPIIVRLDQGAWVCQLGRGVESRAHKKLRDALRTMLEWMRVDSYKLGTR